MGASDDGGIGRIIGVVEHSTPTGVRIEGIWYTLPRDLDARPPDRGARVELSVRNQRFVTGLRILVPPPAPADIDRPVVRASVLRSAARFAGSHAQPSRSVDTLDLAETFEAWVYRPMVEQLEDDQSERPPDRERRLRRESALASVEFLANKPEARPEHVLVLAEAWERWLGRSQEDDPAAT